MYVSSRQVAPQNCDWLPFPVPKLRAFHRTLAVSAIVVVSLLIQSRLAYSQTVCLPLPRLLTTMPMGGQAGTTVEVTITGENLEDVEGLLFSHPGLTAVQKRDAQGNADPNKYLITVSADCPPGLYETRVMSRLGISSSRIFCVDRLAELTQVAGNTSVEKAMELPVDSICNAVMTTRAVDHYAFHAIRGHRYIVNCAARGIDSKLDAVLIIGDAEGRDLVVERRGGMLDFTAETDGRHIVKVHELTFKGGPAYYYRLSIQELPTDASVPSFASTRAVNAFSWPPAGLSEQPAIQEVEPNNGLTNSEIQRISLPCDIGGRFYPAADVDVFEFDAVKGDVWWVEVASERLGRPTDPSIIVQRVLTDGDSQRLVDVIEFTDIQPPMKPSSNGYAYDGPPYNGGSSDIIGRLEIPEDGVYRLQLTDLFGGTRNDDRNIYRLMIRKGEPDFAVAAWGLHMELRNGDRNALSKPLALRGGLTVALEVVAVRRDGFDEPIDLVMEGLPEGVRAQGLRIPRGKTRGIMLITADQNAPRALAEVRFTARANREGQEIVRPVQMAAMAWPIVDAWGEIPSPRLIDGLLVSVTGSEFAPLSLAASDQRVWEVTAGEKLTIPLTLTRRTEFSGSVLQLKTSGDGFEGHPRFDVSLAADTAEAVLDTKALRTVPGDYLISFYGSAVAKYRYNPDAVTKAEKAREQAVAEAAAADAALRAISETASSSSGDTGTVSEDAVATATARKQAADAALTSAEAGLKAATEKASPKDTVDIILSEPISIRVLPAPPGT